jgi:Rhodopirellula transposase DDE domain
LGRALLIGGYKDRDSDYWQEGCPEEVNMHDFVDRQLGKAVPCGDYDIGANSGYVSVGIDHDTAEFAVNSIRRWREVMGLDRYRATNRLMITADGGGSNGSRVRLWKVQLQQLADSTGLTITVCHYPPGTSKWNKIEHRMHLCQGHQGERRRNGRPQHQRRCIPSGMELDHRATISQSRNIKHLFFYGRCLTCQLKPTLVRSSLAVLFSSQ